MTGNLRLIAVHDLRGSRSLSRLLCIASRVLNANTILLLGDTVSPGIIKWLVEECGIRVLGVLGRLDDASIAQSLKNYNGLLESRVVELEGYRVMGLGVIPMYPGRVKVDVLATYKPGVEYCSVYSDTVRRIIQEVKPLLVVAGSCVTPRVLENTVFPGSAWRGSYAFIEIYNHTYKVELKEFKTLIKSLLFK